MISITILGKTASAISMIADNFETKSINVINVINNLNLPDYLPYKNDTYQWAEYAKVEANHKNFLLGSTDQIVKQKLFETFNIKTEEFINCIHPSAQISTTSKFGKGIIVNSLASVVAHTVIGNFVTINRNASIGHHSILEDFVTVCPNAVVCGSVKIGKGSFIGAGAIIRDKVTIGENCIIGAGSVVVKDIPDNTKGYGNPFKSMLKTK